MLVCDGLLSKVSWSGLLVHHHMYNKLLVQLHYVQILLNWIICVTWSLQYSLHLYVYYSADSSVLSSIKTKEDGPPSYAVRV